MFGRKIAQRALKKIAELKVVADYHQRRVDEIEEALNDVTKLLAKMCHLKLVGPSMFYNYRSLERLATRTKTKHIKL